jgi:hypothetical protein
MGRGARAGGEKVRRDLIGGLVITEGSDGVTISSNPVFKSERTTGIIHSVAANHPGEVVYSILVCNCVGKNEVGTSICRIVCCYSSGLVASRFV